MRVGINALYLIPGGVGGTEIYLRNLIRGLARVDSENRYFLYVNRETARQLDPNAANFLTRVQAVPATLRPARILWEQTMLPLALARDGVDILLNPGFTGPLTTLIPQVTVIHDLQHKRHPENFRWFDLPFWNLLLKSSIRRSRSLIAVSQATREDLMRFYDVAPFRVAVVPHGVEQEFFDLGQARETDSPEKILLCVSTLHPHKNLDRLIRVFGRLRERYTNLRLVLAGLKGFHTEVLEARIASLGLTEAITITGWIPREELYGYYRRAFAFVYPSEFEGFGMPVSEALAAGIPTACSAIPPLREIAGECAVYFRPDSEEEMLTALESVLFDDSIRTRLSTLGPRRVAHLSWNASAQATLGILKQALAPQRRRSSS